MTDDQNKIITDFKDAVKGAKRKIEGYKNLSQHYQAAKTDAEKATAAANEIIDTFEGKLKPLTRAYEEQQALKKLAPAAKKYGVTTEVEDGKDYGDDEERIIVVKGKRASEFLDVPEVKDIGYTVVEAEMDYPSTEDERAYAMETEKAEKEAERGEPKYTKSDIRRLTADIAKAEKKGANVEEAKASLENALETGKDDGRGYHVLMAKGSLRHARELRKAEIAAEKAEKERNRRLTFYVNDIGSREGAMLYAAMAAGAGLETQYQPEKDRVAVRYRPNKTGRTVAHIMKKHFDDRTLDFWPFQEELTEKEYNRLMRMGPFCFVGNFVKELTDTGKMVQPSVWRSNYKIAAGMPVMIFELIKKEAKKLKKAGKDATPVERISRVFEDQVSAMLYATVMADYVGSEGVDGLHTVKNGYRTAVTFDEKADAKTVRKIDWGFDDSRMKTVNLNKDVYEALLNGGPGKRLVRGALREYIAISEKAGLVTVKKSGTRVFDIYEGAIDALNLEKASIEKELADKMNNMAYPGRPDGKGKIRKDGKKKMPGSEIFAPVYDVPATGIEDSKDTLEALEEVTEDKEAPSTIKSD